VPDVGGWGWYLPAMACYVVLCCVVLCVCWVQVRPLKPPEDPLNATQIYVVLVSLGTVVLWCCNSFLAAYTGKGWTPQDIHPPCPPPPRTGCCCHL
jgi:hypothetical protein